MADVPPLDEKLAKRLAEIGLMEPTIDLTKRDSFVAAAGWHLDAREAPLPSEEPGPPMKDGPFAAACAILTQYTFPPSRLIRGRFDPAAPLANRAMLLTARFLWMTFELPVRVSRVIDLTRDGRDGKEYAWGYSYQTLAGHLERGEITFEIVKQLATGAVAFRIHSFSQTGHIANLVHRVGFRIVGRRLQQRFAEESLRNMQLQVGAAVAAPDVTTGRDGARRAG
ncbi:MAG: DUF1990 family protein [Gemmatimonadota bacterium]